MVKAHGADNVVITVKILACIDQAGFYDESCWGSDMGITYERYLWRMHVR